MLFSPLKLSPTKPARYNLRKPFTRSEFDKQKDFRRKTSPSPPARRKPATNPLDALLKEKCTANRKDGMRSAAREARLRELAYLNLNDDSEDDDSPKNSKSTMSITKQDDGSPFIDEEQRQQVLEILEGDKAIQDEEEHFRRLGKVGVELWCTSEFYSMNSCEDTLPPITYSGSDPVLQIFVQTVIDGDHALIHLVMESGALEMANYASGGDNIIGYVTDLGECFERGSSNPYSNSIEQLSLIEAITSTFRLTDYYTILFAIPQ